MVLAPDTLIRGKYRITRLIGDGGMGAVYEAEHLILKVQVALKFLHADLAERPGLSERFLREARVSASIQSPHVTRVTDVDTTENGSPFLVMELLRGESLQQLLDRVHTLPEDTSIDYSLQILSGLEAAHALNVVHRDLKPDNVFITTGQGGPVLKLIDFGIAKLRSSEEFRQTLTRAGAMMGTPEYMAPEQLYSAETVDARADIFSLGVMLYEMLSGSRPVDGDEATEIVGQFVSGKWTPLQERLPGASNELASVVERALQPQREDRFETAFAMRMALAPLATTLSHAGQLAATPAPFPVGQVPASIDEPDPSTRRTSVADTLPPQKKEPRTTEDDPALAQAGGTEDAPVQRLEEQARGHAALAPPPSETAERAGASFKVHPAHLPSAPATWRRSRARSALIGVLVFLLVLIAAAIVVLLLLERPPDDVPRNFPIDASPPPVNLDAQAPEASEPDANSSPTPAQPETRPAAPPTRAPSSPPTTTRPGTRAPDAGPAFPPFPSSLPPLPSSLPPLPSGFPTALPSFLPPIPGLTPPPSPGPAPDAGT